MFRVFIPFLFILDIKAQGNAVEFCRINHPHKDKVTLLASYVQKLLNS